MAKSVPAGEVITFYSYKGGTGRSMALANTACLLARRQGNGKGVLMVDWDLEAPGLHRYFRDRFRHRFDNTADHDQALDEALGLIDLIYELSSALETQPSSPRDSGDEAAKFAVAALDLNRFILETDLPSLYLLKAGRFGGDYSSRVNSFNWYDLFRRSPSLFRLLAERLMSEYRYVLVDSRTGMTDTSGICTTLMPEKLVVVFTPNRQSLTGVLDLVRDATRYRRESDDLRRLLVFPLPSRFEAARPTLRDAWRLGNAEAGIPGYQPQFESLLAEVYDLSSCRLGPYLDEVQIQHVPDYAYGEEIAVLVERSRDTHSLTRSFESFAGWLTDSAGPWEEQLAKPPRDSVDRPAWIAEALFARLARDEQEIASKIFVDLVRLSPLQGVDGRRKVMVRDLGRSASRVLPKLLEAGLVVEGADAGERTVELVSEELIREWKRLQGWVDSDREFLLWRQRFREKRFDWEVSRRDKSALLRGSQLAEGKRWIATRSEDFDERDREFLLRSRRRWGVMEVGIALLASATLLTAGFLWWKNRVGNNEKLAAQLLEAKKGVSSSSDLDLALLLTLESLNAANTLDGRQALQDLLTKNAWLAAILRVDPDDGAVKHSTLSPDGAMLATTNSEGAVSLWDFAKRKFLRRLAVERDLTNLRFSPSGKILVVLRPSSIDLFSVASAGRPPQVLTAPRGSTELASVVASPTGKWIAAAMPGGAVAWALSAPEPTHVFEYHIPVKTRGKGADEDVAADVPVIAYNSVGQEVTLVVPNSNQVQLWDPMSGTTAVLVDHVCRSNRAESRAAEDSISRAAFMSDGVKVAVVCKRYDDRILDLSQPTAEPIYGSPFSNVSGDGKIMLSGGEIRRTSSRESLGNYTSPQGAIVPAIDGAGDRIAIAGEKVIYLLDSRDPYTAVRSLALSKARACHIANRNLTLKEWELYVGDVSYRRTCPDLPGAR